MNVRSILHVVVVLVTVSAAPFPQHGQTQLELERYSNEYRSELDKGLALFKYFIGQSKDRIPENWHE